MLSTMCKNRIHSLPLPVEEEGEKLQEGGGTARPLQNHVQCGPLCYKKQACMASNCNKVELIESFQNCRNRTRDI